MKQAAVIIPIYKSDPSDLELVSFKQCVTILKNHDIVAVAPHDLNLSLYFSIYPKLKIERFKPEYFKSVVGYNKLMLSISFYNRFKGYKFILIHQLDAYIFRDELSKWCDFDFDYVGAPVFSLQKDKYSAIEELATLNGGLSLRKVESALKILNHFSVIYPFKTLVKENYNISGALGILKAIYFYLFGNNTFFLFNRYDRNEDFFWALIAPTKRDFLVAPVEKAIHFSFDNHPNKAFEISNRKLPFGCHAFDKNVQFWKQFIPLIQND